MSTPTLSIVIPTIGRNVLDNTIESVLQQSQLPDEFLIWDNSGDGSAKKKSKYTNHPAIKWFIAEYRKPIVDSWNTAVDLSTGDFIYILGDDDLLFPDFVEKVRDELALGTRLIHAEEILIDSNDTPLLEQPLCNVEKEMLSSEEFVKRYSEGRYIIFLGSLVFPRKEFNLINKFKSFTMNALSMDTLLNIELLSEITNITVISPPIWKYRIESANWSGKLKNSSDIQLLLQQHLEYRDYVIKYFSGHLSKYWKTFYRRWIVSSMTKVCYHTSRWRTILLIFHKHVQFKERLYILRDIFYLLRH